MRTVILYASVHHGNTEKVVKAIAKACPEVELINVAKGETYDLTGADYVGMASGVFYGKYHQAVIKAAQALPPHTKVFTIATYGGSDGFGSIEAILKERGTEIVGRFGCKGYDTFGPFKLVGGIAKGHPNQTDLTNAVNFYKHLTADNQ